ncbi:MAG: hypothetical protein AB1Z66_13055, partial [Candidatus Limnocylindrales bacterium]
MIERPWARGPARTAGLALATMLVAAAAGSAWGADTIDTIDTVKGAKYKMADAVMAAMASRTAWAPVQRRLPLSSSTDRSAGWTLTPRNESI